MLITATITATMYKNMLNLQIFNSREYGGWGRISKPQSVAAAVATWDV
jgi:hypothetical protein